MQNKILSTNSFTLSDFHKKAQQQVRGLLRAALSRHNGRISNDDFNNNFSHTKNPAKVRDRLFTKVDGHLEWKKDIINIDILIKKLGNPNYLTDNVKNLFNKSRRLRGRTDYPFITSANKANQIVAPTTFSDPVFGFDILIRPTTEFKSETAGNSQNELHLGENSFAVVIHVDFDSHGNVISTYEDFEFRIVGGDYFGRTGRIADLVRSLCVVDYLVYNCISKKNYAQLVEVILPKAHTGAINSSVLF